jgi:hypothetical protein
MIRLLLVDACVLIDFAKADRSILTLAARHVGEVYVASGSRCLFPPVQRTSTPLCATRPTTR